MKKIIEKSIEQSFSYSEYRVLVHDLLIEGKSTGFNQTESLTNFSLLNHKRMSRLDKKIIISEQVKLIFKSINKNQTWLLITEGWCGDAAQILPVINKLVDENEKIDLKIVLRDDHLELMDLFLTNGSRSIPKLIILDQENNLLSEWGPRPSIASKMVKDYKDKNGNLTSEFKQDLQIWYNKNKGIYIQKDLINILRF